MRRHATPLLAILLAIVLIGLLNIGGSCSRSGDLASQQSKTVKVKFVATVPDETDESDTVYLSGNLDAMKNWNAEGILLKRQKDGEYTATVELPRGARVEYKANRGSWSTVEKGSRGEEIHNRVLLADRDKTERITVATWREPMEALPQQPTTVGDVRYHRDFQSRVLNNKRALIVWLPPGYESQPDRRYPVLYLHDGQNVFDASTSFAGEWRADETATGLIEEKRIEPIIMVGIENIGPGRVDEYTPTRAATTRSGTLIEEGGQGEQYEKFLIEEVKPFIDRTYRTMPDREHTAVAGSSLGGLISLHLAWRHGDVFGMAGCISPSLWWDQFKMLLAFDTDHEWMKREKLWVDMGTGEGTGMGLDRNLLGARVLHAMMQQAGLREDIDFRYTEFKGAGHNEQAWAERFDQVLLFFFGTH
jgi:predicted alpha/beta superfamily hydrolase